MDGNADKNPFVTPTTRRELYAIGFDPQPNFKGHARAILTLDDGGECRLFHGLIDPGEHPGHRTPYAWLEQDLVYGDGIQFRVVHLMGKPRGLTMPAALFRRLARVMVAPGYLVSYTREEVAAKLFALKQYGPWDLKS